MDNEEFKTDLTNAVKKLPPKLLTTLADIATNHMEELTRVLPDIMNEMSRHIQTAMVEAAMGTLDKTGLENTIREVFVSFGVNPDFEKPVVTPIGNMNDLVAKVP
jgi:hypothetical protein